LLAVSAIAVRHGDGILTGTGISASGAFNGRAVCTGAVGLVTVSAGGAIGVGRARHSGNLVAVSAFASLGGA
jgi:hypothetical protein